MNHDDEKTTELELPQLPQPAPAKNNIVRIDFAANADARRLRRSAPAAQATSPTSALPATDASSWTANLDLRSPWVLRLVAVVFVLILSMLVL